MGYERARGEYCELGMISVLRVTSMVWIVGPSCVELQVKIVDIYQVMN